MLKKILSLLLLLTAGQTHATAFPLEIIEYIDDVKVVAFVYEEDVQQSPTWEPFETAPPIDVEDVVQKIQAYADTHPALANAKFEKVELKRIPHHPNHWHYLVAMKTPGDDHTALYYFVMLMDGKVIPALKEPASFK